MRTLVWILWVIFECAQWLNAVQSDPVVHSKPKDLYSALNKILKLNATNCTKYIPENWQQWMRDNGITEELNNEKTMGSEYLLVCLNRELNNVNETSPFSLTDKDNIDYSMSLNEVVSLGFDGILISKALIHAIYS